MRTPADVVAEAVALLNEQDAAAQRPGGAEREPVIEYEV